MTFMILCRLKKDSGASRRALRLDHLEYLSRNQELIRLGGPAIGADGAPELMAIFVDVADRAKAEGFINAEPYNASGEVFDAVEICPWSQVLPEPREGALAAEIEKEKAASA